MLDHPKILLGEIIEGSLGQDVNCGISLSTIGLLYFPLLFLAKALPGSIKRDI